MRRENCAFLFFVRYSKAKLEKNSVHREQNALKVSHSDISK